MSDNALSLTDVISVSILGTPSLLSLPLINTVALFSRETPSWGDDFKIYKEATSVGTDFGSTSNAYKIAVSFFAQQPNPLQTQGYLVIVPRQSSGTETTQAAIARVLNKVYFFGILIDEDMYGNAGVFSSLATYVQTIDKVFFPASATKATYAGGGMFDLVRSGSLTNTRCLFYNDSTAFDTIKMAAAYASRALSTDFSGSLTAQTMHMKALAGVVPDPSIDETELAAAGAAGVDLYVNFPGVPAVFTSGENGYFDQTYNQFWLKFALQTAGFNFLRATNSKIPQTESGINALKGEYVKVCQQGIRNGFLAPGAWSGDVFGNPADLIRCIKDVGFYIYSTPLSQQASADRLARKAPLVQIAVQCSGAVHSSSVTVQVNQ